MTPKIPAIAHVQACLQALSTAEVELLARESGVPVSTLFKVRSGYTNNPGIETVRKFFHLLPVDTQGAGGHHEQAGHSLVQEGV